MWNIILITIFLFVSTFYSAYLKMTSVGHVGDLGEFPMSQTKSSHSVTYWDFLPTSNTQCNGGTRLIIIKKRFPTSKLKDLYISWKAAWNQ